MQYLKKSFSVSVHNPDHAKIFKRRRSCLDDTVTLKWVLRHDRCSPYSKKRLLELFGGRKVMTLGEILDLPIPSAALVWLLQQRKRPSLQYGIQWAADCVEHALPIWEARHPHDPRLRTAMSRVRQCVSREQTPSDMIVGLNQAHDEMISMRGDTVLADVWIVKAIVLLLWILLAKLSPGHVWSGISRVTSFAERFVERNGYDHEMEWQRARLKEILRTEGRKP